MNTGEFNEPIVLTQLTGSAVSDDGVETPTYGNSLSILAEVVEMSGRERYRAQGDVQWNTRVALFKFWKTRDTLYTDRIAYDGETWDIIGVKNSLWYGIRLTEVTAQVNSGT